MDEQLFCITYENDLPLVRQVRAQRSAAAIILRQPSPYTGRAGRLVPGEWEYNRYHETAPAAILAELRGGQVAQRNALRAIDALRDQAHQLTILLARARDAAPA